MFFYIFLPVLQRRLPRRPFERTQKMPAAALPEAEAAAEELPAPPQPASSMAAMHTHRASAKTFFIMIFLL